MVDWCLFTSKHGVNGCLFYCIDFRWCFLVLPSIKGSVYDLDRWCFLVFSWGVLVFNWCFLLFGVWTARKIYKER